MAMQGIDISNHQAGLNLRAIPFDFVIVKATQELNFVDPNCSGFVETSLSMGKATGIYHYAGGYNTPQSEAQFFYNNCKNWVGKVIFALDWERYLAPRRVNPLFGTGVRAQNWIRAWCDEMKRLTGIEPLVYTGAGNLRDVQNIGNRGLWIAQYANNVETGYQANPWNEGAYACAIRQYSSTGKLNGYAPLDLDKFYGNRSQWDAYVGKKSSGNPAPSKPSTPAAVPSGPSGSTLDLVAQTLHGAYGVGNDRKNKLGSRYNEVQGFINHVASASAQTLADETKKGKYGNGELRKLVLGKRYSEVQNIINGSSAQYYTVQKDQYIGLIAQKTGVPAATIIRLNNLKNPNLIYPGQRLRIR